MTSLLEIIADVAGFSLKATAWLNRYGYLDAAAAGLRQGDQGLDWSAVANKAADLAETMHGGEIGELVDRPRCGCSDIAMLTTRGEAKLAQWPRGHVLNVHLADLPRGTLTSSDWADIFRDALQSWSDVCGLKWQLVTTKPANGISVFSENEDGPSKTLAWCELPVGGVRLYRMKLDESESWVKSGRGILAQAVVAHELGHGIGLDHIAESSGKALMNPFYDPAVVKPLRLDIDQSVLRYGPADVVTPPPPAGKDFLMLGGVKYDVTRAA